MYFVVVAIRVGPPSVGFQERAQKGILWGGPTWGGRSLKAIMPPANESGYITWPMPEVHNLWRGWKDLAREEMLSGMWLLHALRAQRVNRGPYTM